MSKRDCYTFSLTPNGIEEATGEQERETRDVAREADTSRYASRNTRERQAVLYLKEKRIRVIVDSLIGDLLLRRPYDPYEYLSQLLDKYILSRSGLNDSPLPFPFYDK